MKYTLKTHSIAAILCGASIMAVGPDAHAQNLLTNPSFELGAFVDQGGGFRLLSNGDTTITGWTVASNVVAWGKDTPPNSSSIDALDGDFFLDLQGPGIGGPYGGVTQTISTVIGESYHLSFYLGTQETSGFAQGPVSVNATAGSTTLPFIFDPAPAATGTQWGEFGFDFTATSTSTPITIQGTATAGGAYIGLDRMSVTVVPEPSTATLLGGSALVLGFIRRRRQARSA